MNKRQIAAFILMGTSIASCGGLDISGERSLDQDQAEAREHMDRTLAAVFDGWEVTFADEGTSGVGCTSGRVGIAQLVRLAPPAGVDPTSVVPDVEAFWRTVLGLEISGDVIAEFAGTTTIFVEVSITDVFAASEFDMAYSYVTTGQDGPRLRIDGPCYSRN